MSTVALFANPDYVRELVRRRFTHTEIASFLRRANPGAIGLSERSIRRFCEDHNIHYSQRLNQADSDVRLVVDSGVREVPNHGGRTVKRNVPRKLLLFVGWSILRT